MVSSRRQQGFTLIELVTVIIILGILAAGASSFLQFSARIFAETSDRDELISSARFAIERLNREIRNAVPNSAEVAGGCLTFTPILASTIYIDIPVAPEAGEDTISVIPFDKSNFASATRVVVYPLAESDLDNASDKNHPFLALDDSAGDTNPWALSFASDVLFETDSPTKRIYFYNTQVSYCINGTELNRNNVLMAQHLDNANSGFVVEDATLQRNAYVQVTLGFDLNSEQVSFTNEIQMPNVP